MSEVGTAYVRLRPQTSTFKAETQSGIRSAFSGIGRVVVPTLAFVGVTEGLRKAVKAAQVQQVVKGQLQVAVRAAGLDYGSLGKQIDAIIDKQTRLGFTEEESARSFALAIRATHGMTGAQRLAGLAADVSRGRNISLAAATQLLVRVQGGQVNSLRRLGIEVKKGISGEQALLEVQKQYSGAASKFAGTATGAQERLSQSVERTAASVGSALLPAVTSVNTKVADWLDNTEHQKQIQEGVNAVLHSAVPLVNSLSLAYQTVAGPLKVVSDLFDGFGKFAGHAFVIGLLATARRAVAGFKDVGAEAGKLGQEVVSDTARSSESMLALGDAAESSAAQFPSVTHAAADTAATVLTIGTNAEKSAAIVASSTQAMSRSFRGASFSPSGFSGNVSSDTSFDDLADQTDDTASSLVGLAGDAATARSRFQRLGLTAQTAMATTTAAVATATTGTKVLNTEVERTTTSLAAEGRSGLAAGAEVERGSMTAAAATLKLTTQLEAAAVAAGRVGTAGMRVGQAGIAGASAVGAGLKSSIPKIATRALDVYIVDQLIAATLGFDPISFVSKWLKPERSAAQISQVATQGYHSLAESMNQVPAGRLARDQAALNVEEARAAVIAKSGAKGTMAYKKAVLDLRGARQQAKVAESDYRAVVVSENKAVETFANTLRDMQKIPVDAHARIRGTGINIPLPGAEAVGRFTRAIGLGGATKSVDQFTQSLAKWIGTQNDLDPILRHDAELVLEFARRLGRIPGEAEVKIILKNKDSLISLDEILRKMKLLGPESGSVGDEIEANLGTAFRRAANEAREALVTVIPERLFATRGPGPQSALDVAKAQSRPGDVGGIRKALDERLKILLDQQKFWEARRPLTSKALKRQADNLGSIYAEEGGIRSQIQSMDDDAAQKRKSETTAAAAKRQRERAAEKRRRMKELADYRSGVADEASSLQQNAADSRKGVVRAAITGTRGQLIRAEEPFRKREDALVAAYKKDAADTKLTAAARRHYASLAISERERETADLQGFALSFRKTAEQQAELAVKHAENAAEIAVESLPQIKRAHAAELLALRKQLQDERATANDASVSAKERSNARGRIAATQHQLLVTSRSFGTNERDLQNQALQLDVQAAQNRVTAAGKNADKVKSATAGLKAAYRRLIVADKEALRIPHLALTERNTYRQQLLSDQAALLGVAKQTDQQEHVSLAQFYAEAAAEFKTYGSNIGLAGSPLSPQDQRGQLGAIIGAMKGGKRKHPPVVIQNFGGSHDPYAAMRSAKQAAEHFYVGG